MATLKGKTLFVTGSSRGIGLAIAMRAATDGANIIVVAKTAEPHPKLPGTVFSAAEELQKAGGQALPVVCDIRDEKSVASAVAQGVERFGGIDIVVNNASAIALLNTEQTSMSRFDLMHSVNARGTFLVSKTCLPALLAAENPHILTLSPPLNMLEKWFAPHVAYSMAKYGMSLCVLGMAGEFRGKGIAVNALWPRTVILTAALQLIPGIENERCRKPEIMADAAHAILIREARKCTGNFFIDDEVLAEAGITDLEPYAVKPGMTLLPDFFID